MSNEDRTVMDLLAEGLTVGDPSNPQEVARALHCARMTLWTSFSLVRDQVGDDAAAEMVRGLLGDPTPAAVSAAPAPAPAPAPAQAPSPATHQNSAAAVHARAEVIYDSLVRQAPVDGDLDARALIWAAASYLYNQQGEEQAVGFLKGIQAKVSLAAWFEQLPVASVARN